MNASVTSWALRLAPQTFATQTSCNAGMTLATKSITRLVRFACHASSHVCFLPFKGSRHTNAGTHDCRSPFQAQTHALVYIKKQKKNVVEHGFSKNSNKKLIRETEAHRSTCARFHETANTGSTCRLIWTLCWFHFFFSQHVSRRSILPSLCGAGFEPCMVFSRRKVATRNQPCSKVREWFLHAQRSSLSVTSVAPELAWLLSVSRMPRACHDDTSVIPRHPIHTMLLDADWLAFNRIENACECVRRRT